MSHSCVDNWKDTKIVKGTAFAFDDGYHSVVRCVCMVVSLCQKQMHDLVRQLYVRQLNKSYGSLKNVVCTWFLSVLTRFLSIC